VSDFFFHGLITCSTHLVICLSQRQVRAEYINYAIGSTVLRVSVGHLAAVDARPSTDMRFRRLLLAPRDPANEAVGIVSFGTKHSIGHGGALSPAAAASFELHTNQSTGSDYVVRVIDLDVCYLPDAIAPILRVFELPPKAVIGSATAGKHVEAESGGGKHIHDIREAEFSAENNNCNAVVAADATRNLPVTYHVFLLSVTLTVVEAAGAAGPSAARRASAATSLLLKHSQAPNGTSCGQVHVQDAQLTLSGGCGDGATEGRRLFGQPVSLSLDYDLLGGGRTRAALQGGEVEVCALTVPCQNSYPIHLSSVFHILCTHSCGTSLLDNFFVA
jgi:hypothetical protein